MALALNAKPGMRPKRRRITPYDHPLRWLVPSEEIPDLSYLVDLSDRSVCPHGICGCHDFGIRIWCPLLSGERPERTTCKHIRRLVRFLRKKRAQVA